MENDKSNGGGSFFEACHPLVPCDDPDDFGREGLFWDGEPCGEDISPEAREAIPMGAHPARFGVRHSSLS